MNIPRCKGASDLAPDKMRQFRRIEEVFRSCSAGWGYQEIRTPVVEYLHLFTAAGTLSPNMLGRVYSFLDWDGWSGERVVLRPDGTIPAARFYAENLCGTGAARLCYVENMFSFEGTGQESRERWQCGVELLGSAEPEGDAELIMLGLEILRKLGLPLVRVKLSHVGLIKLLLRELGVEGEDQGQRLSEILAGDIGALAKIKGQSSEIKRFLKMLLDLKGTSQGFLENIQSVLPEGLVAVKPYLDDLARIARLLDSIGQEYQVDFATGEGFEYYTGMVFQFYASSGLVGNGGRYDELIPLIGGEAVPASGFALFIDKMIPLLPSNPATFPKVLLIRTEGNLAGLKASFGIAAQVRALGYTVELDRSTGEGGEPRWAVSLHDEEGKLLTLTDKVSDKKQKGLSIEQLLKQLGEAR